MTLDRCPWFIAGPLLGILIVGLRAMVNKPLGALGGYIDLAEAATNPRRWGFRAFLLIGTVLGGGLYASVTRGPSAPGFVTWSALGLSSTAPAAQFALLLLAGVAMGFGARTAGGCTSGHGMCGMSLGSPASIVSSMTFFATAVMLAHAFALLPGALP